MLILDNVVKHYASGGAEIKAINEVSLAVERHTLTVVVGPNGCGKSTLLSIAGGLTPPDAGNVNVAGARISEMKEKERCRHRLRNVNYVLQNGNLIRFLTVVENLALPLELDNVPRTAALKEASHALAAVGLGARARCHPEKLPTEMQQRVAMTRAICGGPRIILADEPTGDLDSDGTERVLDLLVCLARSGAACLVASRDPAIARVADRVYLMSDGCLVAQPDLAGSTNGGTG